VTVHNDIPYAAAEPEGSRGHLLDLYVPGGPGSKPLLIATGGSAWLGDNGKEFAAQVADHFTAAGYVVAGVSTRSSAQARFPAQVHDVKAAIRWLRAHARDYGIDPTRFAVMGDSSGGWTATMAGVTGDVRWLAGSVGVTGVSSRVQAVVDLYGPTDFRQMDAHMLPGACEFFNDIMDITDCHDDAGSPESLLVGCAIQTCPERVRAANPIRYVSPNDPPFLIAHGQQDMLVPHHQSELLYAALKRNCVPATFYSVPGVGHSRDIVSPDNAESVVRSTTHCRDTAPRATRPTLDTIETFLDSALHASSATRRSPRGLPDEAAADDEALDLAGAFVEA
jgi:acetyl esterase/lipase